MTKPLPTMAIEFTLPCGCIFAHRFSSEPLRTTREVEAFAAQGAHILAHWAKTAISKHECPDGLQKV